MFFVLACVKLFNDPNGRFKNFFLLNQLFDGEKRTLILFNQNFLTSTENFHLNFILLPPKNISLLCDHQDTIRESLSKKKYIINNRIGIRAHSVNIYFMDISFNKYIDFIYHERMGKIYIMPRGEILLS